MSSINCASCNRQRNSLTEKSSLLLPGMKFLMCTDCISRQYEPRWAVIMASQQFGTQAVKKYISKKLYAGDIIAFEEVI